MQSLSVIIPVYNAELSLRSLHEQLQQVLKGLCEEYEIIMVDDDSGDRSWFVVEQLVATDPRVRGIRLNRNFGQHNALLCGIRMARFEIIVTMDDDLQHPPEEIRPLLDKLGQGYDVVYGSPLAEQHGFMRNVASRITKLALQAAMGVETARSVSAFRAFRTKLRDAFADYRSPYVSIDVLLTWGTSRFSVVPVRHAPRIAGQSNYTMGKLFTHAFNLLTGFSTAPLQLASALGFIFTLFGVGTLAWVLGRYLISGSPVPGFPFLASIIVIFSGVQLFALGIFGEYLARMHVRTLERPQYVVGDETTNAKAEMEHSR